MIKKRISISSLLMAGAMGAGLLCGAGIAKAQDYQGGYYQGPPAPAYNDQGYNGNGYHQGPPQQAYENGYQDGVNARSGYYDTASENAPETVIVHPYYGEIEKQQLHGTVDGERDPVAVSASRPVSYADLDLSRRSDFREFRIRVYNTARQLCREVGNYHDVDLIDSGDQDQCVRNATRDAMRQVGYPEG